MFINLNSQNTFLFFIIVWVLYNTYSHGVCRKGIIRFCMLCYTGGLCARDEYIVTVCTSITISFQKGDIPFLPYNVEYVNTNSQKKKNTRSIRVWDKGVPSVQVWCKTTWVNYTFAWQVFFAETYAYGVSYGNLHYVKLFIWWLFTLVYT